MGKLTLLAGVAAGAGAAYLLDPAAGSERRHKVAEQFRSAREKMSDEEGRLAPRDLLTRTKEAVSDIRGRLQNGYREELAGEARDTAREMASTGRWSPRTRVVAAGLGGALALYGMRRTSLLGLAVTATGIGLIARAVTNLELRRNAEEAEGGAPGRSRAPAARASSARIAPPPQYQREGPVEASDAPTAADLRNRAAEEEMTAFTENPDSIPSD